MMALGSLALNGETVMRLIRTTCAYWEYKERYFADGKPISGREYARIMSDAKTVSCLVTDRVSLAGGFLGYRHSQEVTL